VKGCVTDIVVESGEPPRLHVAGLQDLQWIGALSELVNGLEAERLSTGIVRRFREVFVRIRIP
jgi:hypothetical protein